MLDDGTIHFSRQGVQQGDPFAGLLFVIVCSGRWTLFLPRSVSVEAPHDALARMRVREQLQSSPVHVLLKLVEQL